MSQINGIGTNHTVQKIAPQPVQKQVPAGASPQVRVTDKLELSGTSYLLKHLKTNDIRTDKVAAVRAQIEAGSYEDDKKMDVAVSRLLDDLDL